MGTTAQKLEYLGTTKSQLKDMINYGLDEDNKITNSTTFRNYVSSIFNAFLEALRTPDTLFTNLPKKSGTGANITLNDTANAPMRIELGATELTQDGTPTPSSPQDIHTISGSNTIKVEGKNLFDINNLDLSSTYYTKDGNELKIINGIRDLYTYSFKPNTQYTISLDIKNDSSLGNGRLQILYTDGTTEGIGANNTTTYESKVKVSNSSKTVAKIQTNYGNTGYFYVKNIQIEEGTTATTYEPYVSQEADIDLGYENLLNLANGTYTGDNGCYATVIDGEITLNGTATGNSVIYIDNNVSLQAIQYTWSANNPIANSNVIVRFGTNIMAEDLSVANRTKTATLSSSSTTKLCIRIANGTTLTNYKLKPQLEKGSVAHSYTEYGKAINYGKIGNYEDKFIRNSGKNMFDSETLSNTSLYTKNPSKIYYAYIKMGDEYKTIISGQMELKGTSQSGLVCGFSTSNSDLVSSNQLLNYGTLSNKTYDFTNATDVYFIIGNPNGVNIATDIPLIFNNYNIMINKGTTALPYEPYGSNEWYIKKNIKKIILNGTESGWQKVAQTSGAKFTSNQIINDCVANNNQICSHFANVRVYTTGWIDIFTDDMSLEDWKSWLASNLPIVYYACIPTYTQITGTLAEQLENVYQGLKSYSGQTNISQVNNDLSFVINASALEELS